MRADRWRWAGRPRLAWRRVVSLVLLGLLLTDVYLTAGWVGAAMALVLIVGVFALIEASGGMPKERARIKVDGRWEDRP